MIHKQRIKGTGAFLLPGKIIHVGEQGSMLTCWYETGPDRAYEVAPTGGEEPKQGQHVGSAVGVEGWLVLHVYEVSQ